MLDRFRSHKHLKHFILYSITFLTYGACISGLGPYIPYLSVETGIVETQYSYLFSARSFGMLTGAIVTKVLQKYKLLNHTILIISALTIGVFSWLFSGADSSLWLGVWLFLLGAGYSIMEIMINVCILIINNPKEIEFWMLLTHGLFGIGGLLGPIMVYLFETKVFVVLGLATAAVIPFVATIESPERAGCVAQEHQTSQKLKAKTASFRIELCLCLMMFLYIGNECTYGGWISSFAVLSGVADNKGATVFPTIFWIMVSVCRLGMAFVPGSSTEKLKLLIKANVLSGVISLIAIYAGHLEFACYLSGILFGVSMSSIYPLVFAFPLEHGLNLEDTQSANIVMSGVVSEGLLTMLVGALMQWIHLNMLFYSLSFVAVIMWLSQRYCLGLINQQKLQIKNSDLELQLVQKKGQII